uniref:Uncharacterized protein n=1 Tax=Arundo donax TaxID=35708 RepID=A0A0A8YAR1_ARUDO
MRSIRQTRAAMRVGPFLFFSQGLALSGLDLNRQAQPCMYLAQNLPLTASSLFLLIFHVLGCTVSSLLKYVVPRLDYRCPLF